MDMVQTQRNNEEALLAMGHWEDLYLQIFSGDTDPILYYVNHTSDVRIDFGISPFQLSGATTLLEIIGLCKFV